MTFGNARVPSSDDEEPSKSDIRVSPPVAHVFYREPACVMATWQNVSIAVWGTQGSLPLVERFVALSAELAPTCPNGVSTIHLIVNDAPLPSGDARARLDKLTKQYNDKLVAALTILVGSGFWYSAMRGFITSLHWVQGAKYPAHVCGTIEEGASWLCPVHTRSTGVFLGHTDLKATLLGLTSLIVPTPTVR